MLEKILELKNLEVIYKKHHKLEGKDVLLRAVNEVTLELNKGEILALAGESGCGKSTLAKTIINLIKPSSGKILFKGKDVSKFDRKSKKEFIQKVQMIFQNPYSSLNPKMKIYEILKEPLLVNKEYLVNAGVLELSKHPKEQEYCRIIEDIVDKVGLAKSSLELYPHEFSGGQRQRIAIARALIMKPEIVLADEPVSALDVSIQAQILNLLMTLKNELNLTILFISHDMNVINYISDRVVIMYLGEIMEQGLTSEIFDNPKHPYTKSLLSAVPQLRKSQNRIVLNSELPSQYNLPKGCKFSTRCYCAMERCKLEKPQNTEFSATHCTSCFLY